MYVAILEAKTKVMQKPFCITWKIGDLQCLKKTERKIL